MTTGATGQLGLALPVQGELSGTWGDTVNNGITQYTNIAIAATLTLTNDGAVTLANTTGDASASNITSSLTGAGTVTAQFAIVRITGTLTTTKVVTAPSYSKTYVVVNAATGGTVTFKASGQTGVSIAVGESAWVYYNGTDYVKIAGTTSGSAGGSNTQVQYNSSGSLAGSSNLTFDGTSLTLGGNPTLSAGTANGVTYLNGSKVLTSGSALQFDGTNLLVGTTTATYNQANRSSFEVNGSSTSIMALKAGGTGQAYWYYDGAGVDFYALNGSLRFGASGSESMRLTSTGLGIGTSSPAAKLDVSGGGSSAKFNTLDTYDGGASLSTWMKVGRRAGTGTNAYINTLHSGSDAVSALTWAFGTSGTGTEVMRLDSAGNLGLGVTPSASTYGKALEIGSAGNEILSAANDFYVSTNAYYNSGWKYGTSTFASQYNQTAGSHRFYTAPSGTAGNAISFTQAMTLGADGNLAVGTTTTTAARLTLTSTTLPALTLPNIAEGVNVSTNVNNSYVVVDVITASIWYFTQNATGNWTLNIRGSGSVSLNSMMSTGQSITMALLCTQGSTAYYSTALQIDGNSVTPKWQGGTAPSSGNASSIDVYSYTIIKTASATFTVLASQTKFA